MTITENVESKSPRVRKKTPLRLWVGTRWISSSRQLWRHWSFHPTQRDCSSVKTRRFSSANTFSLNSRTFKIFPSWIRKCTSNGTYLRHWGFRSFVRVILREKRNKSMKWMLIYTNNAHQSTFNKMAKHLSQYQTKQKSLTWLFFTGKKNVMAAKTINWTKDNCKWTETARLEYETEMSFNITQSLPTDPSRHRLTLINSIKWGHRDSFCHPMALSFIPSISFYLLPIICLHFNHFSVCIWTHLADAWYLLTLVSRV